MRRKKGFGAVDWLLLLGLVVAVALVGARIYTSRHAAAPTEEIIYTLCQHEVPLLIGEENGGWEQLIPTGSAVTSSNGTAVLGSVITVWVSPTISPIVRDGEIVLAEIPDRVDLYVKVRADAVTERGAGFRVSDIRIAAADTGDYRVGSYLARGARVLSVNEKGEAKR